MGSLLSKLRSHHGQPQDHMVEANSLREEACGSCKRKRDLDPGYESKYKEDQSLDSPARKKFRSTSQYIYQTLFLNGENSDIKVCALGQIWKLHKIYLLQSRYFHSMFNGSWREANLDTVQLEIPDQNVDTESLQVVFGSFYQDDAFIKPDKVIGISAAARMLQLDGLIEQCEECMVQNMGPETACGYYYWSHTYGMEVVMKRSLQWLLHNFMTRQTVALMKDIGVELMEILIQSSDLFVMHVEMDVYTALKKWMYLRINPAWEGPFNQLRTDANCWFRRGRLSGVETLPFLATTDGAQFLSVFKSLRLQYIINNLACIRILMTDNIIPHEWLTGLCGRLWCTMLRTEQENDIGPREPYNDEMASNSMRCSRMLCKDEDCVWCWIGFNYGFDLLVSYTNHAIVFRRNAPTQPRGGSVSLQVHRTMVYRVRVASFDDQGNVLHFRSTSYHFLSLEQNQVFIAMNLDSRLLTFPLLVCCNFLYTSPPGEAIPLPFTP